MPSYTHRGTGITVEAATPEEAARKFNAMIARMPPPGTPEAVQHRDIVGKAKAALLGEAPTGAELQGDPRDPSTFAAAVRGIGEAVLPGSIPELAVVAALPFAGRLGTAAVRGAGLARGLARTGVRVGATSTVGAAGGAESARERGTDIGEGAISGAQTGAIAQSWAELFRGTGSLVEAATERWGNLDNQGLKTRVATVLGPELGRVIEADIPSLRGHVRDITDVYRLQDPETGSKILGREFNKQEAEISRLLANKPPFKVDESVYQLSRGRPLSAIPPTAGPPAQMQPAGAPAGTTIPIRELNAQETLDVAKRLRAMVRSKDDALSRPAREKADELTQEVIRVLRPIDAAKADAYEALRGDWSKFVRLNDFLSISPDKLFPGGAKGSVHTLDLPLWADRLIAGAGDVTPTDFPNLHRMFLGPLGTEHPSASHLPIFGRARIATDVPGVAGLHAYEGGRLKTVKLPPRLQESVGSPVANKAPGVLRKVGTASSMIGVPAIAGPGEQPAQ